MLPLPGLSAQVQQMVSLSACSVSVSVLVLVFQYFVVCKCLMSVPLANRGKLVVPQTYLRIVKDEFLKGRYRQLLINDTTFEHKALPSQQVVEH